MCSNTYFNNHRKARLDLTVECDSSRGRVKSRTMELICAAFFANHRALRSKSNDW